MNVLSLFDGISCGYVALKRADINIDNYYSSEIDKYAIAISKYNYPNIIQLGDVNSWQDWNIDYSKIDLLLAGFPCQSWSMSGKQMGDKDARGQLMWIMLDILEHIRKINPKIKFLFKNVKMKKDFEEYVNKAIGIEPILINSALLSAQNRNRNYWTNLDGIKQPEDKGIYLRDIIEEYVDEKYFIKQEYLAGINKEIRQKISEINKKIIPCNIEKQGKEITNIDISKACCILTRDYKGFGNQKQSAIISKNKPIKISSFGNGQAQRIFDINGKSVTLVSQGGGQGAKTGLYAIALRGRNIEDGKIKYYVGAKTKQRLETSFTEKSNCLTTVQKDSLILDSQNFRVRRLTPLEYERLQTLPDNYSNYGKDNQGKIINISNTQRYKVLGNAWTIDVISHILKNLNNN